MVRRPPRSLGSASDHKGEGPRWAPGVLEDLVTRKRFRLLLILSVLFAMIPVTAAPAGAAVTGDMVITGVVDGPLTGGVPKAIELYVVNNIADLSIYGIGAANNGGGTDGEEFTFPAVPGEAGDYLYVASESAAFTEFFGFAPDYTSGAASINGDDAIELFMNGSVVDIFGDINVDGSGQAWEYTDGWAHRVDDTGQDGSTFVIANWTFSGPNALDGESTNASAATPFPIGEEPPRIGPGDLVINEIDYDQPTPPTSDSAEFIEVKNTTDGEIDLTDVSLVLVNGSNGTVYNTIALMGTIAAGDYYVVCGDAANVANCDLDSSPNTNFVQNGGPDAAAISFADSIIDTVSYEGDTIAPYTEGSGFGLADDAGDGVAGISRCEDGFDTNQNNVDFVGARPITPGATNDCPVSLNPGDLVINEIIQNPDAVFDSNGEWFEIYNNTADPIDLQGLVITDDGSDSHTIGSSVIVASEGYAVLGNNADITTNGGVSVDYEYSGVFLGNSDDEVVIVDGGTEVDRVNYDNGATFPDPTGASMALIGTFLDNNQGVNWCESTTTYGAGDSGTPGAANDCPTTKIHDIQGATPFGASDVSPLDDQTVIIEGIVVGDFQESNEIGGFHVQEEDSDADADPDTSEGIYVFAPNAIDVSIGDTVRVTGSVSEFFGLTELTAFSPDAVETIAPIGTASPAVLTLPLAIADDFERYEGMSVTLPQPLVIAEYFNYDRFGEIVLSSERNLQPTAEFAPGSAEAVAAADLITRDRLTLDDGQPDQNPDFTRHPNGTAFTLDNRFRGGDTLSDVIGVMDYAFGAYKIQPTGPATYNNANPRPASPDDVGGDVTVASFNVLNYYTTLDQSGSECFPSFTRNDCRGADNVEEFERQRAKIILAIAAIDADVVGLIEIENNVDDDAVIDLVAGINDAVGPGTYDYVPAGTTGTDTIKVAFIYKPAVVSLAGAHAILDTPAFLDPANTGQDRNRAALAQTFTENATGESFTAVVNHFKSKSGSETDDQPDGICVDGDPANDTLDCDQGDGQGFFNDTRTQAAQELAAWLATDPTGSADPDVLVIGDLNAYDKEDPIDALTTAGYADLVAQFQGEDAYSYVFDGQIGYLDYGMANESLLPAVTGTTVWHVNADEPDLLDYDTSFKSDSQAAIFDFDSPFRASDHDPVIVGLNLADLMSDKEDVAADLEALLPTGSWWRDRLIDQAIDRLEASLNPSWWASDSTVTTHRVFNKERQAVAKLTPMALGNSPETAAAQEAIATLVAVDRQLAEIELIAAIADGGTPWEIQLAELALANGDWLADRGLNGAAITQYKVAWLLANGA